jgi:hypothetical protein
MFNDLHKLIDFEKFKTILIESENIDGSFLIHHALSFCLKNNKKTIFITLSQTLSHYKSVQSKFGNSAQFISKTIENGCLLNIDILSKINNVTMDLNSLLNTIELNLCEKIETGGYDFIIIDDLSILYLLGCTLQQIFKFVRNLRSKFKQLNIVININSFDDNNELKIMIKNIAYVSNVHFYVSHLKTGYSKDIQGQLTIYKSNYPYQHSKDTYLYKTSDRNVSLHAHGSIV